MKTEYNKEVTYSLIIIISFFLVSAFTTGIFFTISSIILSFCVAIFCLCNKSTKYIVVIYLFFISLLLIPVIFGSSGVRPGNWIGLSISFLAYFLFADYLNKRPYIIMSISKTLYYSYLVFLSILLIVSYSNNINYGDYINKIFTNTSRNVVIYFCFVLCVFYLFSAIINKEKINFTSLLVFCFYCLISGSRTALILSVLLLSICLLKNFRVVILLFIISIFIFLFIEFIEDYVLSHTNFNQGLETPRTLMYSEYTQNLDVYNFLFGMSFDKLPTVILYGDNPHNTFIYINMLFGFNVIIFFIFLLFAMYNYTKFDIRLSLIFFLLIVRLSLDTLSYNNFFTDIIILYLIMNSFHLPLNQNHNN